MKEECVGVSVCGSVWVCGCMINIFNAVKGEQGAVYQATAYHKAFQGTEYTCKAQSARPKPGEEGLCMYLYAVFASALNYLHLYLHQRMQSRYCELLLWYECGR